MRFKGYGDFMKEEIPAPLFGLFRIFYGLITLSVAATSWRFIEFNFFESFNMDIQKAYVLCGVWIALLIFLVFGYFVRTAALFSMLMANLLFDTSIGADLTQIGAFWLMLSNSHKSLSLSQNKQLEFLPAWPAFGLILNIVTLDAFSGIAKLYDPFWMHGYGFYMTLLEPWLRDGWFPILLLNNKFLMVLFNYLTIIFQILGLPFLLFKRTRSHGVFLLMAQYILLTYPIRIDPIGPIGLALCIPALGLIDYPFFKKNLKKFLLSKLEYFEKAILVYNHRLQLKDWTDQIKFLDKIKPAVPAFIFSFMALMAFKNFTHRTNIQYNHYPLIVTPVALAEKTPFRLDNSLMGTYGKILTSVSQSIVALNLGRLVSWIPRPVQKFMVKINRDTVNMEWWAPFTMKHFLGRFGLRVILYDRQGNHFEPLVINYPNGQRGPYESGLLRNSVLQNRSWNIGRIAMRLNRPNYSLSDRDKNLIRSYMHFALGKLEKPDIEIVSSRMILVPIQKPNGFVEINDEVVVAPNSEVPLVEYSFVNKSLQVLQIPKPFQFEMEFHEISPKPLKLTWDLNY